MTFLQNYFESENFLNYFSSRNSSERFNSEEFLDHNQRFQPVLDELLFKKSCPTPFTDNARTKVLDDLLQTHSAGLNESNNNYLNYLNKYKDYKNLNEITTSKIMEVFNKVDLDSNTVVSIFQNNHANQRSLNELQNSTFNSVFKEDYASHVIRIFGFEDVKHLMSLNLDIDHEYFFYMTIFLKTSFLLRSSLAISSTIYLSLNPLHSIEIKNLIRDKIKLIDNNANNQSYFSKSRLFLMNNYKIITVSSLFGFTLGLSCHKFTSTKNKPIDRYSLELFKINMGIIRFKADIFLGHVISYFYEGFKNKMFNNDVFKSLLEYVKLYIKK